MCAAASSTSVSPGAARKSIATFSSGIESADSRASAKLEEVRDSFEKILERIDGVLAARARSINETLARSTVDAAKTLSEGGREIAQSIAAKSSELEATLRQRAETLSQALSELAGDINAKLADRLDDMSGALGNSVTRFRDDIVGPLHTLSVQLQSGGAEIAEAIARHAANVGETVESHVQRIGAESTAQLVARIEEMRGLVEGPAADLVSKIGARGDEVADQIAGVSVQASQNFEQQINNLVALLTRRGDDLLAAISATAAGSVRELGALSGQIGVAVEVLDRRPAGRRRGGADRSRLRRSARWSPDLPLRSRRPPPACAPPPRRRRPSRRKRSARWPPA